MSEQFKLDRKFCFQNRFYKKCINVIIDSIGPSIILRSIYSFSKNRKKHVLTMVNKKGVNYLRICAINEICRHFTVKNT